MHTVELQGSVRTRTGKGGARQERAGGATPGVLYGAGEAPVAIHLDTRDFEKVLRREGSGTFLIDLKLAGREGDLKAIIKELQRDPVTSKVIHVDLQHISLTQRISVHVPVHLHGTAIGVKEGGILEHLTREIEVECLATEIPERIEIDVSHLSKGHSIHVREIAFAEGITVVTPGERVVATVVVKAIEATPEPAAAVATAPAAEGGAAPAEGKAGESPAKSKGDSKDS